MKVEFSGQTFGKVLKCQSFVKNRIAGGDLFRADRRSDTTKLVVTFRNFANSRKNQISFLRY
jgi:hypothetical protein